jgi:hypothetical protein
MTVIEISGASVHDISSIKRSRRRDDQPRGRHVTLSENEYLSRAFLARRNRSEKCSQVFLFSLRDLSGKRNRIVAQDEEAELGFGFV